MRPVRGRAPPYPLLPTSSAPDPSRIQTVDRQSEATLFLVHDSADIDHLLVNPVWRDEVSTNKAKRVYHTRLH